MFSPADDLRLRPDMTHKHFDNPEVVLFITHGLLEMEQVSPCMPQNKKNENVHTESSAFFGDNWKLSSLQLFQYSSRTGAKSE